MAKKDIPAESLDIFQETWNGFPKHDFKIQNQFNSKSADGVPPPLAHNHGEGSGRIPKNPDKNPGKDQGGEADGARGNERCNKFKSSRRMNKMKEEAEKEEEEKEEKEEKEEEEE